MPLGSPVVPPTSRNNASQVTPESPRGGENNKPVAVLYPFGDVRSWGLKRKWFGTALRYGFGTVETCRGGLTMSVVSTGNDVSGLPGPFLIQSRRSDNWKADVRGRLTNEFSGARLYERPWERRDGRFSARHGK